MELRNWLVISVDTDQWMIILLAMGTGKIVAEGPDAVNVTVARHVRSTVEYIHVNRIFQVIAKLTEIREHAGWPSELLTWLDNGAMAVLFVVMFVLSGCDFLPAIVKHQDEQNGPGSVVEKGWKLRRPACVLPNL